MTEFQKGDKVRLTKGENVLMGTIITVDELIQTDFSAWIKEDWETLGWKIEVAEPAIALPTEGGYYLDFEGDIWYHDGDEFPADAKDYAPFTRLYTLKEAGDVFWGKLLDNAVYDPYDSIQRRHIRKVLKEAE